MPRNLAQTIGIAVGSALLAAGMVYFLRPKPLAGDDDPIIVSGGSMRIVTKSANKLQRDGNELKHVDGSTRYVSSIDVFYHDNTGFGFVSLTAGNGQQVNIDMPYCPQSDCRGPRDTVTFYTDGSSYAKFKNSPSGVGASPIGGEASTSNAVDHAPDWHIQGFSIAIGGGLAQPYSCVDGKCFVIIHYSKP